MSMRKFNNLNEVLLALDTITMEEAEDINKRLGISFSVQNGKFTDAEYEMADTFSALEPAIGE